MRLHVGVLGLSFLKSGFASIGEDFARIALENLGVLGIVYSLLLGAVIFCIGVFGVIARRNAVMVLMSIELILNSVNLNLVAFALMNDNQDGHVFALYVIAIAAAEVGVGLAMVLMIYRNRRSIALDELSEMKG